MRHVASCLADGSPVERARKEASQEARKYSVDMTQWKSLVYDQQKHDAICRILDEKHDNMNKVASVSEGLKSLQSSHVSCIDKDNIIIGKIQAEIDSITVSMPDLFLFF